MSAARKRSWFAVAICALLIGLVLYWLAARDASHPDADVSVKASANATTGAPVAASVPPQPQSASRTEVATPESNAPTAAPCSELIVEGTVIGVDNRGVPDIAIRATLATDESVEQEATSGEDGTFSCSFENLPDGASGDLSVVGSSSSYEVVPVQFPVIVSGHQTLRVWLLCSDQLFHVSGTLEYEDGESLSGGVVQGETKSTVTDRTGHFELEAVVWTGTMFLTYGVGDGNPLLRGSVTVSCTPDQLATKRVDNIKLVLPRADDMRSLEIVDELHQPIADVEVSLEHGPSHLLTDPNGRCVVHVSSNKQTNVWVRKHGYAPTLFGIHPGETDPDGKRVVVLPELTRVVGTVVDIHGRPCSDATIQASIGPGSYSSIATTSSGADGRFAIDVARDGRRYFFSAVDRSGRKGDGAYRYDGRPSNLVVVLHGRAKILGRVTDATGHPIERALVTAMCNDCSDTDEQRVETSSDGAYSIDVSPSVTYEVQVFMTGFQRSARKAVSGDTVDFVLSRRGFVSGRVLDANGASVTNFSIQVFKADGSSPPHVLTNRNTIVGDGTFSLDVDGVAIGEPCRVDVQSSGLGQCMCDAIVRERPEFDLTLRLVK